MIKRKRLGQHFLTSGFVAKKIVESAEIKPKDVVLEIGTGKGILVPLLCQNAKKVISIESDNTLYQAAKEKFSDYKNLELIHGDGFKSEVKFSIFVSNLPYSKSRDAIEWLIQKSYSHAVLMVQKEFYEKLVATGKNRRAVSIFANYCTEIKKISNISKNNFNPSPKVDSVVIKISRKKTLSAEIIYTVNKLFSYKRKNLQNIFKQFGKKIVSDKRLEDLDSEEIINIAKKFLNDEPYQPSEDTYFLEDNIVNEKGNYALDIGTGTGYLSRTLSKNFSNVIATDIDYNSLATQNKKQENRICCDAAEPLNCKFDLIICNMPYLQSDEILDRRVDGGKEGVVIPLKIIKSAIRCLSKTGRMLFVTSSLANYEKLISESQKLGLELEIVVRKKLFYEELLLVQAKLNKQSFLFDKKSS